MTVDAVVPIRFADCCAADGSPRLVLSGRPLWELTLERAAASPALRAVVVAYDDPRFAPHLEPWRGRVRGLVRPPELSLAGKTTLDVLAFVSRTLQSEGSGPDYLMLLEISHPFRPAGIISEIVAAGRAQRPDSLVTCRPVHYNFWRRRGGGPVERLAGAGDRAGVAMFQEMVGIGSLFSPRALLTDNPFGEQVDIVPIDRFWTAIDVRDADGLWLAERYLERIGGEP